jgi:hypothetical protein
VLVLLDGITDAISAAGHPAVASKVQPSDPVADDAEQSSGGEDHHAETKKTKTVATITLRIAAIRRIKGQ